MAHLIHEDGVLSREQSETLDALLEARSKQEAATRLGISRATLYRRLRDPDLKEAYRAARSEALADATATLQVAAVVAVKALLDILSDPTVAPYVRVTSASRVLELAYKAYELEDLEARLEALEAA